MELSLSLSLLSLTGVTRDPTNGTTLILHIIFRLFLHVSSLPNKR